MRKTLAFICSIFLFGSAYASEKAAYNNNLVFAVDLMLGTDNYISGATKVNWLNLGYNSPGASLSTNLIYGAGLHASYYKRHFAMLGDIAYRQGTVMGQVSGTNTTTPGTGLDLNAPANSIVYSVFKTKVGVGYAVILSNETILTPFVGASYKTKTHNIPNLVSLEAPLGSSLSISEVNTLLGIPMGLNIRVGLLESLILEAQATYHLLWTAQTSTQRTDKIATILSTATSYSETGPGVSLLNNSSIELACNILWLMSDGDFGLTSLGLGLYYDGDYLAASLPNTAVGTNSNNGVAATLPSIKASEYGVKLSFNF